MLKKIETRCEEYLPSFHENDSYVDVINEYFMEKYMQKSVNMVLPYVSGTSGRLIPKHIWSENRISFVLHKGLILFHGSVSDEYFIYPFKGSFFSTTPGHSLRVIMEKILKVPDFPGEKVSQDDFSNKVIKLSMYILLQNVNVTFGCGDNGIPKFVDGVVAGCPEFDLNELVLNIDLNEKNLLLLEDFILNADELRQLNSNYHIYKNREYHDFAPEYAFFNLHDSEILKLSPICPPPGWKVIKKPDVLVYIFAKLTNADIRFKMLLFAENSNVYINKDELVMISIITGEREISLLLSDNERYMNFWPLIKYLVEDSEDTSNSRTYFKFQTEVIDNLRKNIPDMDSYLQ